ncbi:MAG TPA: alpha/beta fold hydrolase [Thermoanaerobaculia bacterium]|nr:alpha/beta fold hydrolase [Thermoanaerobaculia bacterium]
MIQAATERHREQFVIESDEGLPIRAVLEVPARARALILVIHGFKGFKEWGFFPWLTDSLGDAGFAACRFDLSRNGVGEDPETFERLDLFVDDTYSIQLADLGAVERHLSAMPLTAQLPTFLLGHSRGGAVAILGASSAPRLKGVITWSAISTVDRWDEETRRRWRSEGRMEIVNQRTGQIMPLSTAVLDDLEANRSALDIHRALERLHVPILVVHGTNDESVPSDEAKSIAAAAPNSSLVLVEGGSHTFNAIHPLVHVPKELRLVTDITTRFLSTYC